MNDKDHKTINQGAGVGASPRNHKRPSLTIDYELYWHYLDNSDLTDEQKREFLDALWSIIVSFVDLGFAVHPLQQAVDQNDETGACEQNAIIRDFIAAGTPDVLDLSTKPISQPVKNGDMQSGILESRSDS